MATVLCTGIHEGPTTTRKLVLEAAGHTVVTALSSTEIIAACRDFQFDVAIIGESGQSQDNLEWAALVRERCPGVKILEISPPNGAPSVPLADGRIEAPEISSELAGRVAELITKQPGLANSDQIRELCLEVLKAEKGADFETALRKLAEAVEQYPTDQNDKKRATEAG